MTGSRNRSFRRDGFQGQTISTRFHSCPFVFIRGYPGFSSACPPFLRQTKPVTSRPALANKLPFGDVPETPTDETSLESRDPAARRYGAHPARRRHFQATTQRRRS